MFSTFSFQELTEGGAAELGLSNVGGVFVVLIGGLTLACFMVFFEVLWDKRQQRRAALLVREKQVRMLHIKVHIFWEGQKMLKNEIW